MGIERDVVSCLYEIVLLLSCLNPFLHYFLIPGEHRKGKVKVGEDPRDNDGTVFALEPAVDCLLTTAVNSEA